MTAEAKRLEENKKRQAYWTRWGPYVSERQWGTVREDYSKDGSAWEYFPHSQSLISRLSLGRRRYCRNL